MQKSILDNFNILEVLEEKEKFLFEQLEQTQLLIKAVKGQATIVAHPTIPTATIAEPKVKSVQQPKQEPAGEIKFDMEKPRKRNPSAKVLPDGGPNWIDRISSAIRSYGEPITLKDLVNRMRSADAYLGNTDYNKMYACVSAQLSANSKDNKGVFTKMEHPTLANRTLYYVTGMKATVIA